MRSFAQAVEVRSFLTARNVVSGFQGQRSFAQTAEPLLQHKLVFKKCPNPMWTHAKAQTRISRVTDT